MILNEEVFLCCSELKFFLCHEYFFIFSFFVIFNDSMSKCEIVSDQSMYVLYSIVIHLSIYL